jgi:ADP-heptose:LPS heptosyltransferase
MCAAPREAISRRLWRGLVATLAGPPRGGVRRRYRAVILKVDRIGDFVLALGAIRTALRAWGEDECLLVVSPLAEELAAAEFPRTPRLVVRPCVGRKHFLGEARRVRRALGAIECDLALTLRHQRWDFDELTLSWLRAKRILALEDRGRAGMFAARRAWVFQGAERIEFAPPEVDAADPRLSRELEMHRRLLTAALGRTVTAAEVLPTLERPAAPASAPAAPVVVCPFGSHASRDLAVAGVVAAWRAFAAVSPLPARVCVLGSAAQRPQVEAFAEGLRAAGGTGIAARCDLSLSGFVEAIARAPLVLATESAAAHLATALDRPALVWIGGGHFGQFGPWHRSEKQVWLTRQLDCFGCDWRCIHPTVRCLGEVSTAEVAAAAQRLARAGAFHG